MMDKIYEDFTTKLLPSIQEGLVITKDYFMDLFGRYVKYLIVSDTISIAVGFLGLAIAIKFFKFSRVCWKESEDSYDRAAEGILMFLSTASVFVSFLFIMFSVDNLIKDIYIPEVRVYQEITSHMNRPSAQ
jgi:hypothetical protein